MEKKYGISHWKIGARLDYLLGDEEYENFVHKRGPKFKLDEEMIKKIISLHDVEGKRFYEIDELLSFSKGTSRANYVREKEIIIDEREDKFNTKSGTHAYIANFAMEIMIRKNCSLNEALEKIRIFYHNEGIINEAKKLIESASTKKEIEER